MRLIYCLVYFNHVKSNRNCVQKAYDVILRVLEIKSLKDLPFPTHCPLVHMQSPLHHPAPFPCGQPLQDSASCCPQLTPEPTKRNIAESKFESIEITVWTILVESGQL